MFLLAFFALATGCSIVAAWHAYDRFRLNRGSYREIGFLADRAHRDPGAPRMHTRQELVYKRLSQWWALVAVFFATSTVICFLQAACAMAVLVLR